MIRNIKYIQKILLLFMFAVILLIVTTPFIIKNIYVFNREQSETILLAIFVFLGIAAYKIHKVEIEKKNKQLNTLKFRKVNLEKRLEEAFAHIGKINIQISEIRSIFSDIEEYPETKKDMIYTLEYFSKKILSSVDTDWVKLKIISLLESKTLETYFVSRGKNIFKRPRISNKDILDGTYDAAEFIVVTSDQQNLNLKTFCILPKRGLSKEQLAIIKAVLSRLELIYVIFSSHYYKDSRSAFINNHTRQ